MVGGVSEATNFRILTGDCREVLRTLPDASVQCCVTSPPYWGLRSYGGDTGMIGLEPTFDEHLSNLVDVFREVRRVLRKDGTVWLNYGDAYGGSQSTGRNDVVGGNHHGGMPGFHGGATGQKAQRIAARPHVGSKQLMMMPARVAMALQADGWWLRSEVIWHKPNPMPEPCTDRPTSSHEKLFLLTKSARYFYDADAVRSDGYANRGGGAYAGGKDVGASGAQSPRETTARIAESRSKHPGANLRNVWTIPTHSFKEAHFATFPPKLVEPCIKAGTSERGVCGECGAPWKRQVDKEVVKNRPNAGNDPRSRGEDKLNAESKHGHKGNNLQTKFTTTGWEPTCEHKAATVPATVLDPFAGSGTVGHVALSLGRKFIGIEISAEYTDMAMRRVMGPLFAETGGGDV